MNDFKLPVNATLARECNSSGADMAEALSAIVEVMDSVKHPKLSKESLMCALDIRNALKNFELNQARFID